MFQLRYGSLTPRHDGVICWSIAILALYWGVPVFRQPVWFLGATCWGLIQLVTRHSALFELIRVCKNCKLVKVCARFHPRICPKRVERVSIWSKPIHPRNRMEWMVKKRWSWVRCCLYKVSTVWFGIWISTQGHQSQIGLGMATVGFRRECCRLPRPWPMSLARRRIERHRWNLSISRWSAQVWFNGNSTQFTDRLYRQEAKVRPRLGVLMLINPSNGTWLYSYC